MSFVAKGEVKISFGSSFDYLDAVQEFSERIAKKMGFDEDAQYWIGLSLRESLINAIQHGNKKDEQKEVGVEFKIQSDRLIILVRDQGEGLDESRIPDPLSPENILKPGGRGIFYVRSFMDAVSFRNLPEGGMEMRMEKRLNHKQQGEGDDD